VNRTGLAANAIADEIHGDATLRPIRKTHIMLHTISSASIATSDQRPRESSPAIM